MRKLKERDIDSFINGEFYKKIAGLITDEGYSVKDTE